MNWNDLLRSFGRRKVYKPEDCDYPDCNYVGARQTKPKVPKHNPNIPTDEQDIPVRTNPVPKRVTKPKKRI